MPNTELRRGKGSLFWQPQCQDMTEECQICLQLWRKPLISVNQLTPLQLQTPLQRRVRRNGKPSTPTWNTLFSRSCSLGAWNMDLLHLNSSPAVEALQVHFLQFCVWHWEIHIILCLCSLTRLVFHCTYLSCSLHRPLSQLMPKLMAETDRVLLHYLHSFFHKIHWNSTFESTLSDLVSIRPWVLAQLVKNGKCYCVSLVRKQIRL